MVLSTVSPFQQGAGPRLNIGPESTVRRPNRTGGGLAQQPPGQRPLLDDARQGEQSAPDGRTVRGQIHGREADAVALDGGRLVHVIPDGGM